MPHRSVFGQNNYLRIVDGSLYTLITLAAALDSRRCQQRHPGISHGLRLTALGPMSGGMSVFAMVERRSIEYCMNQGIIAYGPSSSRIQNAFDDGKPQSGWHLDALHLMAQVCLAFLFKMH